MTRRRRRPPLSSLVRLEHTLFALPYAYVGAILAVDGWPGVRRPRLDHRRDGRRALAGDGAEPPGRRRDRRAQPAHGRAARSRAGLLSRDQVIAFCLVSLAVFALAVSQLAPITRWLAPIPVVAFVIYPYLKRFTPLCHLWLGAVDGLAPVGAWVGDHERRRRRSRSCSAASSASGSPASTSSTRRWTSSTTAREGLHSIPADFGIAAGSHDRPRLPRPRRRVHDRAGLALDLGRHLLRRRRRSAPVLLAYENAIVKPDDLSRVNAAFFNVNAILAGHLPRRRRRSTSRSGSRWHPPSSCAACSKRFGERIALRRVSFARRARRRRSALIGRQRIGQVDRCCGSSPASRARPPARRCVDGVPAAELRPPRRAGAIGYLGHRALAYRGLTAAENLALLRAPVPAAARAGSTRRSPRSAWPTAPATASTASRAACSSASRWPGAPRHRARTCCCSTSPRPGSTTEGAALLDDVLDAAERPRTMLVATHDARVRARATRDRVVQLARGEVVA